MKREYWVIGIDKRTVLHEINTINQNRDQEITDIDSYGTNDVLLGIILGRFQTREYAEQGIEALIVQDASQQYLKCTNGNWYDALEIREVFIKK